MIERCVICGRKHTEDFPKVFPKEWELCCFCLSKAETIIEYGVDFIIERVKESYKDYLNPRKVIRKYEKISKLINLVG